ncbi:MAG: glycosyltransferase family 4 protein [Rhizobiaceae bacterium]
MATPLGAYTRTTTVTRILLVTDAWKPQVNGVVQTLERLSEQLEAMNIETAFLTPSEFTTAPLPTYPDIKLALATQGAVRRRIATIKPDHIHIVTEGPLGMLARWHCLAVKRPFTTSYHTRFPEYVRARAPIPESWTYAWLKRFHNAGAGTLVATPSLRAELTARGFDKIKPWTRGVDTEHFHPRHRGDLNLPRPVFLFVGRVAVEKNIEAFLALDLPGSKAVVGTGPALNALKSRYPDAHFLGQKRGLDLAQTYASADVFVFPSRTDTFGVVLLEAMASGLPVAAYPVTGPIDVVGPGGALSEDLRAAALQAFDLDRDIPRKHALTYSWSSCAEMFMQHVRAVYV